jgi:hypothetical protein|tara:strand:+ start:154 stop:561 length:408 start_codon:yes stop_codon:yes gene_type:complete
MGVDRYQVTEAKWNYIQGDGGVAVAHTGATKSHPSELVRYSKENLSKDFYRNSWFRALNDIQNSEKFMSNLDNIYWEVKYKLLAESEKFEGYAPLNNREIIYKLNLGPSVSDSYFMEIKFNFHSDEITIGLGENI